MCRLTPQICQASKRPLASPAVSKAKKAHRKPEPAEAVHEGPGGPASQQQDSEDDEDDLPLHQRRDMLAANTKPREAAAQKGDSGAGQEKDKVADIFLHSVLLCACVCLCVCFSVCLEVSIKLPLQSAQNGQSNPALLTALSLPEGSQI